MHYIYIHVYIYTYISISISISISMYPGLDQAMRNLSDIWDYILIDIGFYYGYKIKMGKVLPKIMK